MTQIFFPLLVLLLATAALGDQSPKDTLDPVRAVTKENLRYMTCVALYPERIGATPRPDGPNCEKPGFQGLPEISVREIPIAKPAPTAEAAAALVQPVPVIKSCATLACLIGITLKQDEMTGPAE